MVTKRGPPQQLATLTCSLRNFSIIRSISPALFLSSLTSPSDASTTCRLRFSSASRTHSSPRRDFSSARTCGGGVRGGVHGPGGGGWGGGCGVSQQPSDARGLSRFSHTHKTHTHVHTYTHTDTHTLTPLRALCSLQPSVTFTGYPQGLCVSLWCVAWALPLVVR
jgi:hypothetical protein